jgi:hypothetical protein
MKKLTDEQLIEMYENPAIKVDISTQLGLRIMQAVQKANNKTSSQKPNYDHKQGIN